MARMMMARVMAVMVLGVSAGAGMGQGLSLEAPGGGGEMVPTTTPAGGVTEVRPGGGSAAGASTMPSAQSILQGLLQDKATTTGPGAGAAGGAEVAGGSSIGGPELGKDGLLLEGQQIELRSGHLRKTDKGTVFEFDARDMPAYPAMGTVPSRRLAAMEDAAGLMDPQARQGGEMTFRIFAEVTQYRGKNYLYIKPSGESLPTPPAAVAAATSTAPAGGAAAASGTTPQGIVPAVAPEAPAISRLPERSAIYNRTGRLVKDVKTGAEVFVLDSDGQAMMDPPMGVVPSKYLAVLEDATDYGSKSIKFRVSGEVTQYRGKNYIYLKFVQEVKDLHQGLVPGLGGPIQASPPATQATTHP